MQTLKEIMQELNFKNEQFAELLKRGFDEQDARRMIWGKEICDEADKITIDSLTDAAWTFTDNRFPNEPRQNEKL